MLGKLIKYELIRKKNILMISASITFLVELFLLFMLYKGGGWIGGFITVSFLMIFGMAIFILIDNVNLLSSDLNKKSGYMLFLTPNHGYNIIGAKMIVGLIEALFGFTLVGIFCYINYKYASYIYYEDMPDMVKSVFESIVGMSNEYGVRWYHFALVIASQLVKWLTFITTVYLALILRKTLVANAKFKGIISFLIFVVLNIVMGTISQGIIAGYTRIVGMPENALEFASGGQVVAERVTDIIGYTTGLFVIITVISILFIGLFYWYSSYLLTKKIDL